LTRLDRLPGRRITAWLIDWLCILVVPVGLIPVGLLALNAGVDVPPSMLNAGAFGLVIVPATLWAAWRESSPRGATPGKRFRRLRVVDSATGEGVTFGRGLIRNTAKIAVPWELGHTAAFGFANASVAGQGGTDSVGTWLWAVTAAAYAIVIVDVAALFVGSGRTPYDRLSRTRVVRESGGRASARR
jgi:uncharacterized RDD family membrane protein YckC